MVKALWLISFQTKCQGWGLFFCSPRAAAYCWAWGCQEGHTHKHTHAHTHTTPHHTTPCHTHTHTCTRTHTFSDVAVIHLGICSTCNFYIFILNNILLPDRRPVFTVLWPRHNNNINFDWCCWKKWNPWSLSICSMLKHWAALWRRRISLS